MFASAKSPFVTVRTKKPPRRPSELNRAVHHCFPGPPIVFHNQRFDQAFGRFYWSLRAVQYKLFYRDNESDVESLNELIRIEPPERPPSMEHIMDYTQYRFSRKWIKYMYARFKNVSCAKRGTSKPKIQECPSGRMRYTEFKRIFGAYVPDRMDDDYLNRMFKALCHTSPYDDQLTFKDLIGHLSKLYNGDPRASAEWTVHLIGGPNADRIYLQDFNEFVKSVFHLVGRDRRKQTQRTDSLLTDFAADKNTLLSAEKRSTAIFKDMDVNGTGFLTVDSFEQLFRKRLR
ncbi:Protein NCS-5 a [Aphelenchoides avenae]|nr:Protein NCS-5 a [Aphelenchus avenae]